MTPDELSTKLLQYFEPSKSKVLSVNRQAFKDALGFELSNEQLIGLCGAPAGSVLKYEFVSEETVLPGTNDPLRKIEEVPSGLLVTIENSIYISGANQIVLYSFQGPQNGAIRNGIYIKLIKFRKGVGCKGFGACMLTSMLKAARALPFEIRTFDTMRMMAAGGRSWGDMDDGGRWGGYNVWPKYGFDMPLHAVTKSIFTEFPHFPKNLLACKTVLD